MWYSPKNPVLHVNLSHLHLTSNLQRLLSVCWRTNPLSVHLCPFVCLQTDMSVCFSIWYRIFVSKSQIATNQFEIWGFRTAPINQVCTVLTKSILLSFNKSTNFVFCLYIYIFYFLFLQPWQWSNDDFETSRK